MLIFSEVHLTQCRYCPVHASWCPSRPTRFFTLSNI